MVDTKNTNAVKALVQARFAAAYPEASPGWLGRLFDEVEALFRGGHPDFAAIDLQYHDWEHTLEATLCLALLLEGRDAAEVFPRLSARHYELAMAAVLLHDSGYLRSRSDVAGTGAKYTFCHVLRSCAFAATYLPTRGVNEWELEVVLAAINCTGPKNEISRLTFRDPIDRVIGAAVATADYLGQMAAPDYPDELPILFREFEESDNFTGVPRTRRLFRNPEHLIARTPHFWRSFVRPKLDGDFQGLFRFLARPFPDGANDYVDAVEANIDVISQRIATRQPACVTA